MECSDHFSQFTYIEYKNQQVKLLCNECLEEQQQNGLVDMINLILMSKVRKVPEELLKRVQINEKVDDFFNKLSKIQVEDIQRIKKQQKRALEQAQQKIENLLKESEAFYENLEKSLSKYRDTLKELVQFDKFIEMIDPQKQAYAQNTSLIKESQNKNVREQILNYIQSLKSNQYQEQIQKLSVVIQEFEQKSDQAQVPNAEEILNQLGKILQEYSSTAFIKASQVYPNNLNFTMKAFGPQLSPQTLEGLMRKVSVQMPQYNLIYNSRQDGLNTQTMWSKITGQNNLLMIFKSLQNKFFGGYSPCKWTPVPLQVPDETLKSFLFSIVGGQIQYYELKVEGKHCAIKPDSKSGPIFGQNDLQINADFKSGGSKLGGSYKFDQQFQFSTPQNALFGGNLTPNIEECYIYQLKL